MTALQDRQHNARATAVNSSLLQKLCLQKPPAGPSTIPTAACTQAPPQTTQHTSNNPSTPPLHTKEACVLHTKAAQAHLAVMRLTRKRKMKVITASFRKLIRGL